jgi:hypothetical protein
MTRDRYFTIQIGLREPETPTEVEEATTVAGMRRIINRASRESSIVCACFEKAWIQGMTSEETYVTLAYHALISLQKAVEENIHLHELLPMPAQFPKMPP